VTVEVVAAVTVRVTVRQTLLTKAGDPPAPAEMPPTKSAARAAANMNLRIMSSLLSSEADVSRTGSTNHCRDGKRPEFSADARRAVEIRGARNDRTAARPWRRSGKRVGVVPVGVQARRVSLRRLPSRRAGSDYCTAGVEPARHRSPGRGEIATRRTNGR